MTQINVTCTYCNTIFKREKKAYNSSKKKGGDNYKSFCSKKCAALFVSIHSVSKRAVNGKSKICTKCLNEGCEFHIGATWCKKCISEYQKKYRNEHPVSFKQKEKISVYQKQWRFLNKKRIAVVSANYYKNNKNRLKSVRAFYYKKNKSRCRNVANKYYRENRLKILANQKKFLSLNKERIRIIKNKSEQKRINNDPSFKLRKRISAQIRLFLNKNGFTKNSKSILNYLPYTIQDLKQHLEKQFESWMNWENYGIYNSKLWKDDDTSTWKWNIDHIIPQSKFSYNSMEDESFKMCWSLENLRPLSAKQNLIDGVNKVR